MGEWLNCCASRCLLCWCVHCTCVDMWVMVSAMCWVDVGEWVTHWLYSESESGEAEISHMEQQDEAWTVMQKGNKEEEWWRERKEGMEWTNGMMSGCHRCVWIVFVYIVLNCLFIYFIFIYFVCCLFSVVAGWLLMLTTTDLLVFVAAVVSLSGMEVTVVCWQWNEWWRV